MKCLFSSFITLISFLISFSITENLDFNIKAILENCCDLGKNSAKFGSCDISEFDYPINVSSYFLNLCQSNAEFCCEKVRFKSICNEGKNFALKAESCKSDNQSEIFTLCCNACRVGQQIAMTNGKCSHLQVTIADADLITHDCCKDLKSDLGEIKKIEDENFYNLIEENDESSNHEYEDAYDTHDDDSGNNPCEEFFCEHFCTVLNNQPVCECNEGFVIAQNNRECVQIFTEKSVNDCELGFTKNKEDECEDIDECKNLENHCSELEDCHNTKGSYRCVLIDFCPNGFTFDKSVKRCVDVDECILNNTCSRTEICINTAGSYNCEKKMCLNGYELVDVTGNCVDINECLTNSCPNKLQCVNFSGSFSCECHEGFEKDHRNYGNCLDIDECKEIPQVCSQHCYNTYGSFKCSCKHGYKLNTDNFTCIDVNECERNGKYYCRGSCINTVGGFRCDCPLGFNLIDDRYCVDINECVKPNFCTGKHEHCLNTYGSHKCLQLKCDDGYRMLNKKCRLMDLTRCYDDSNEVSDICKIPQIYSFHYGTIIANCTIPYGGQMLYNLISVPKHKNVQVEIKKINIIQIGEGVEKADLSFFKVYKNNGTILLLKSLNGPQEIEIDYWVHDEGKHKNLKYIWGNKIFLIVSAYSLL